MSQLSYNIEQKEAFAGMKGDSRFDTIESFLGETIIPFGYGVMSGVEDAVNQVRLPSAIKSVLTTNIALEASNSTVITINGEAMTAVVYAASDGNTMALIVTEILTHEDVYSAVLTSARVITVIGLNGIALTITGVTTGGTNQAAWTPVATDPGVFRGISVHRNIEKTLSTGVAQYAKYDAVDVMRKGTAWMLIETTGGTGLAVDETPYINLAVTAQAGKVTDVSSGNIAVTTGRVKKLGTDPAGLAMALIEINMP